MIYAQSEKMLERLESHEKHDNVRFNDVNTHLWELRLTNARRNGSRKDKVLDKEENEAIGRTTVT